MKQTKLKKIFISNFYFLSKYNNNLDCFILIGLEIVTHIPTIIEYQKKFVFQRDNRNKRFLVSYSNVINLSQFNTMI